MIEKYLNKIICADCLPTMKEMPSNSVDLVVTSPPYNLKNSTGNGMKLKTLIPQSPLSRINDYTFNPYILNQPEHHKKKTFVQEYDEMLKHYQQTLKIRDKGGVRR